MAVLGCTWELCRRLLSSHFAGLVPAGQDLQLAALSGLASVAGGVPVFVNIGGSGTFNYGTVASRPGPVRLASLQGLVCSQLARAASLSSCCGGACLSKGLLCLSVAPGCALVKDSRSRSRRGRSSRSSSRSRRRRGPPVLPAGIIGTTPDSEPEVIDVDAAGPESTNSEQRVRSRMCAATPQVCDAVCSVQVRLLFGA